MDLDKTMNAFHVADTFFCKFDYFPYLCTVNKQDNPKNVII